MAHHQDMNFSIKFLAIFIEYYDNLIEMISEALPHSKILSANI